MRNYAIKFFLLPKKQMSVFKEYKLHFIYQKFTVLSIIIHIYIVRVRDAFTLESRLDPRLTIETIQFFD